MSRQSSVKENLQRSVSSLLWRTLSEYARSSGLHGLGYLGERGRPWTERVWWTLAIIGSLLAIASLILQAWQQWTRSPVLVSFVDKPTPVWNIPFPTITVCSPNKYRKKVFDMTKTWRVGRENLTDEERRLSDDLMLVNRPGGGTYFKKLEDYPRFADWKTVQNIIKMAPPLSDTLICEDLMTYEKCRWVMGTVLTKEGLCYSNNMMPDQAGEAVWNLEEGYPEGAGWNVLPIRAQAGFSRGVVLAVMTNQSEADYTQRPVQAIMIGFNSPADFPQIDKRIYLLPVTGMTYITVSPHVMDTDEALRSYSPQQRHCYFPSERRLAHFSTYTQDNCDLECLTNYTLRVCRCVDFYMPRNAFTPICGYGSSKCVYNAKLGFFNESLEDINQRGSDNSCDCLPACVSISYTAEISQGEINSTRVREYLNANENYTINSDTTIHFVFVFMKDGEFLSLRRRELYRVASFIANCGGLLGLCCGFSVLTLAELVYFFTLRMWNNAEGRESRRERSIKKRGCRDPATWRPERCNAWVSVRGRRWTI